MWYMQELVLGLKPEAQPFLRVRPNVKIVWGLKVETGADGEIVNIEAEDIRNEPVVRSHWEAVHTRDMQHFDLQVWGFPFRMKDKYRDEYYRTICRRVEYPSRILRTSTVIVVEVVDGDDERVMPESVWSDEDIKIAVEKIEQASPFALVAEWADLCRYIWKQIWDDNGLVCQDLEIASYQKMIGPGDLRRSLKRYFYYGLGVVSGSCAVKERMAKLEADHGAWNRLLMNYLEWTMDYILGHAYSGDLERVESLIFNDKPLDPIYHILAGNKMPKRIKSLQRYIEEKNRENIQNLYSYARDKPLLFC